jgi:hypothetical protein
VREWLGMALRSPRAFCGHTSEDNFAWVALVCNRSLPAVLNHPTRQLGSSPSRFTWAPLSFNFLLETLEAGACPALRQWHHACTLHYMRARSSRVAL